MVVAIKHRDFGRDLRVPQLHQHVIGIPQRGQMISVVLQIFSNRLRRVRLVGIHQPETCSVGVLFADLLNRGRVASRHRTIAAQENQHRNLAGIRSQGIYAVPFQVECALLCPRQRRTEHQRGHNRDRKSESESKHRKHPQNYLDSKSLEDECPSRATTAPHAATRYNGLSVFAQI